MIPKERSREIIQAIASNDVSQFNQHTNGYHPSSWKAADGRSWLHFAAGHGSCAVVDALLARGADINQPGGVFHGGPLVYAAANGHVAVARKLMENGAPLDVSKSLSNPLFAAISGGHLEMVKCLVDAGIDYSIAYTTETMDGMNAVTFAYEQGKEDIAQFLESLGEVANPRGGRPD